MHKSTFIKAYSRLITSYSNELSSDYIHNELLLYMSNVNRNKHSLSSSHSNPNM